MFLKPREAAFLMEKKKDNVKADSNHQLWFQVSRKEDKRQHEPCTGNLQ